MAVSAVVSVTVHRIVRTTAYAIKSINKFYDMNELFYNIKTNQYILKLHMYILPKRATSRNMSDSKT